jgi:hypothetical protein
MPDVPYWWRSNLPVLKFVRELAWRETLPYALVLLACLLFTSLAMHHGERTTSSSYEVTESVANSSDDRLATYTLWLALFTAALACISGLQIYFLTRADKTGRITAEAARDSAHAATEQGSLTQASINQGARSSRTGLRAYVYPQSTDATQFRIGNAAFMTVSIVWKNMGQTPMRHGQIWLRAREFPGRIPPDFDFPKNEFLVSGATVAGPGQEFVSQINIGFRDLQDAFAGTHALCVYGAAEYDDVFRGTQRRKTEFCYQIKVMTEPALDGQCGIVFEHYTRHNGADSDCYRPPDPYQSA